MTNQSDQQHYVKLNKVIGFNWIAIRTNFCPQV